MNAFTMLILVCATSLEPQACDDKSANDVIRGPKVANEMMCMLHGQAQLASLSITPEPGKEYVKIVCTRGPIPPGKFAEAN